MRNGKKKYKGIMEWVKIEEGNPWRKWNGFREA